MSKRYFVSPVCLATKSHLSHITEPGWKERKEEFTQWISSALFSLGSLIIVFLGQFLDVVEQITQELALIMWLVTTMALASVQSLLQRRLGQPKISKIKVVVVVVVVVVKLLWLQNEIRILLGLFWYCKSGYLIYYNYQNFPLIFDPKGRKRVIPNMFCQNQHLSDSIPETTQKCA